MTAEGAVKKACEDLLKAERIPCYRMNSGNAVIPGRGRIRLNAKGTADLLASPLLGEGLCGPRFLWIECKRAGGQVTSEQWQFADFVRKRGEYWLLVHDVKILQEWLRDHKARGF